MRATQARVCSPTVHRAAKLESSAAAYLCVGLGHPSIHRGARASCEGCFTWRGAASVPDRSLLHLSRFAALLFETGWWDRLGVQMLPLPTSLTWRPCGLAHPVISFSIQGERRFVGTTHRAQDQPRCLDAGGGATQSVALGGTPSRIFFWVAGFFLGGILSP